MESQLRKTSDEWVTPSDPMSLRRIGYSSLIMQVSIIVGGHASPPSRITVIIPEIED